MEGWQNSVDTLAEFMCRHLQTAYAGLQKFLQKYWAFVQSVTPDIGMAFQVAEDEFQDTFLLALFQGGMSPVCQSNRSGFPSLTQLGPWG